MGDLNSLSRSTSSINVTKQTELTKSKSTEKTTDTPTTQTPSTTGTEESQRSRSKSSPSRSSSLPLIQVDPLQPQTTDKVSDGIDTAPSQKIAKNSAKMPKPNKLIRQDGVQDLSTVGDLSKIRQTARDEQLLKTSTRVAAAPKLMLPLESSLATGLKKTSEDLTKALPHQRAAVLRQARSEARQLIENASPQSDIMVHVATKTDDELRMDIIKSVGLMKDKYGKALTPIFSKYEHELNAHKDKMAVYDQLRNIRLQLQFPTPQDRPGLEKAYADKLKEFDPSLTPVYPMNPITKKPMAQPSLPPAPQEPVVDMKAINKLLSSDKRSLVDAMFNGLKDGIANAPNRPTSTESVPGYDNVPKTFKVGDRNFEFKSHLATGGGGQVFLYRDLDTDEEVVLKTAMHPASVSDEARDHHYVASPNVVGMLGTLRSNTGESMFVMEKALMDLKHAGPKIETHSDLTPKLREEMNLSIVADVITGMQYLHEQRASHNDMKNTNVYIAADGTGKVADVGEMRVNPPLTNSEFGSFLLNGPEVLDPTRDTDRLKNDVWTTGLMLYGMFNKDAHPFDIADPNLKGQELETAMRDKIIDFGKDANNRVYTKSPLSPVEQLINAMLHPDPNQRPSFESISKLSMFQNLDPNLKPLISATLRGDDAEVQRLALQIG